MLALLQSALLLPARLAQIRGLLLAKPGVGGEDGVEPFLVGVEVGLEKVGQLRTDGLDEAVVSCECPFVQRGDGEGVELRAWLEEGVEEGGSFCGGEGGDSTNGGEGLHVWGNN